MGLFNKKPSKADQMIIKSTCDWVSSTYKSVVKDSNVDAFLSDYNFLYSKLDELINFQKKYPSFFGKNNPTSNLNKINSERKDVEHDFVNRFIMATEKKLLKYSTTRGKQNNFNKEIDVFRYHAGDFMPETVTYFQEQIEKRFKQYL